MNRRFLLTWILVFVLWMAGSFLVHGLLLHDDYAGLPNLFRPEAEGQKYFPFMLLAHVLLAGSFVWIYSRGVTDAPWVGQGLRFGIALALLGPAAWYLIYYAVQPMPASTVVKQIAFDAVVTFVLALVTAWMYRAVAVRPAR